MISRRNVGGLGAAACPEYRSQLPRHHHGHRVLHLHEGEGEGGGGGGVYMGV